MTKVKTKGLLSKPLSASSLESPSSIFIPDDEVPMIIEVVVVRIPHARVVVM